MYYIVNETNQIIAADESLLSLCELTHINELSSNIALKKLTFDILSNNQLILTQNNNHHTFSITSIPLSSFLGNLTLITLNTNKQTSSNTTVEENIENTMEEIDIDNLIIKTDSPNDNITIINEIEVEEEPLLDISEKEPEDLEDTSLYELNDSTHEEEKEILDILPKTTINDIEKEIEVEEEPLLDISEKEPEDLEDTSLYELNDSTHEEEKEILDILPETTVPEKDETFLLMDKKEKPSPKSEIIIDIIKVSEEIGVSKEDFSLFLNEYIDTALDLEEDLKSSDDKTRSSAIQTLLHLSEVLHLDVVDDILEEIHTSTDTTRTAAVTSFYDALSRITTTEVKQVINDTSSINIPFVEQIEDEPKTDDDIVLFDLDFNENDVPKEKISEKKISEEVSIESIEIPNIEAKSKIEINTESTDKITSFGKINLAEIQPIHFDFQVSAAADELSLPESLIEEFMIDFVEQAHTETDKMLIAYKKGDLDTVNKIGHLLKGVSSNLRITTLSDTLYKIQFCEEPNDLENLIKDYWGHFLFFEKQINMLSN